MAFTVEDGSIVAGANSYATTAEFVTLMEDMGETTLAEADDEQIEAALVKGAMYMEQKFRLLWRGSRAEELQRLSWPRRGVPVPDFFDPFFRDLSNVPLSFQDTLWIAENEIPYEVKVANILLAKETFDSSGNSTGVLQSSIGGRKTKREKLGVLEVEYFNDEDAGTRQKTVYWDAEKTVEPFMDLTLPYGGAVVRN